MTDHSDAPYPVATIRSLTRLAVFFVAILLVGAALVAWTAWQRAASLPQDPVAQSSKSAPN